MKKPRFWITSLSLSQQLVFIVFAFLAFFAIFFLVYINTNVTRYTEKEMFKQLTMQQNIMRAFYVNEKDIDFNTLDINSESAFITTYYFQEREEGKYELFTNQEAGDVKLSKGLQKDILYNLHINQMLFDGTLWNIQLANNYVYTSDPVFTYYSIYTLDDDIFVVSLLDNHYVEEFKANFLSNVMDITIFVVGMFFLIMLIWVGSIIRPLNQIRNYIEKVKSGEDYRFRITREDEIGEVANALIDMRDELARQEKVKEEMIHNISHDLKTPVATIKSYGESIKDGIYPYDTLEKSVDVIIDNATRLEKKVYSLLFLNRVEYLLNQDSGNTFCDMKEIVSTVVLNTKVIRPDIEIESNLAPSLFYGNDEAWRVCVENILENALRYAKTQIVITLDEEQLCIYNDGSYIEEERLQSLFKPYEKGQGGQFGLGLSIVNRVVNANMCSVVAENVETGGVIFIIRKKEKKKRRKHGN
ncbi:MAG: ATP-binding protein [Breznakia sp.]